MNGIRIPPPTPEALQRMEKFKRKAAELERELQESRAAYIERNGITPEEEYQLNFYPYHAFIEI